MKRRQHIVFDLGFKPLAQVTLGGKTGIFYGGHPPDVYIQCTSTCCKGKVQCCSSKGGSIYTASKFKRHAVGGHNCGGLGSGEKPWKRLLQSVYKGRQLSLGSIIRNESRDMGGAGLIGRRLAVCWWSESAPTYYEGSITGYNQRTHEYTVLYDDGDVEKLLLWMERFKWLPETNTRNKRTPASPPASKAPKTVARVLRGTRNTAASTEAEEVRGSAGRGSVGEQQHGTARRKRHSTGPSERQTDDCSPARVDHGQRLQAAADAAKWRKVAPIATVGKECKTESLRSILSRCADAATAGQPTEDRVGTQHVPGCTLGHRKDEDGTKHALNHPVGTQHVTGCTLGHHEDEDGTKHAVSLHVEDESDDPAGFASATSSSVVSVQHGDGGMDVSHGAPQENVVDQLHAVSNRNITCDSIEDTVGQGHASMRGDKVRSGVEDGAAAGRGRSTCDTEEGAVERGHAARADTFDLGQLSAAGRDTAQQTAAGVGDRGRRSTFTDPLPAHRVDHGQTSSANADRAHLPDRWAPTASCQAAQCYSRAAVEPLHGEVEPAAAEEAAKWRDAEQQLLQANAKLQAMKQLYHKERQQARSMMMRWLYGTGKDKPQWCASSSVLIVEELAQAGNGDT